MTAAIVTVMFVGFLILAAVLVISVIIGGIIGAILSVLRRRKSE
jgi:hypothetical protein